MPDDSANLPPRPPSPKTLAAEQRAFTYRLDRARARGAHVGLAAILVAIVNLGGAIAAVRSHEWFLLGLSLLWAGLAIAGRLLVGWANAAWQEVAVARVERAQAYEVAEQWRVLYLQATGHQDA
jgi:hypothetical protein